MNKDVLTSVCRFLCEYGYVPRNMIAGSYDKPIFGVCFFFEKLSSEVTASVCISTSNW